MRIAKAFKGSYGSLPQADDLYNNIIEGEGACHADVGMAKLEAVQQSRCMSTRVNSHLALAIYTLVQSRMRKCVFAFDLHDVGRAVGLCCALGGSYSADIHAFGRRRLVRES